MKEKRVIKDSFIQKSIDICRCPEPCFCTVATTMYDNHTRERKCMKCWFEYCKRNNIEIDYENQSIFFALPPCFRRAVHGRNSAIFGGAPITQFYVLLCQM